MNEENRILVRSKHRVRFANEDMDFNPTWVLGGSDFVDWSQGEVFFAAGQIKEGDGDSWRRAFHMEGQDSCRAFKSWERAWLECRDFWPAF